MPHKFDIDRYLRDYPLLTPGQRDASVRLFIWNAKVARAEANRQALFALGRWSRAGAVRVFDAIRPIAVFAARLAATGWRRYQLRRQRRLAAERLYAMDDHALKDIGLRRCEIEFVLRSAGDDATRDARALRRGASAARREPLDVQRLLSAPTH